MTIAARISQSWFVSDARKASAAPWSFTCALTGRPISRCAASMAFTASPSDAPRARLNEIVAAGNWPMRLTTSGAGRSVTVASADNGICVEPAACGVAAPEGRAAATAAAAAAIGALT